MTKCFSVIRGAVATRSLSSAGGQLRWIGVVDERSVASLRMHWGRCAHESTSRSDRARSARTRIRHRDAVAVVDLDRVARQRAEHAERHREAVVAVRHDRAAQRPIRADDPHAVRKLSRVAPMARRLATTAAMRSLSFTRSSAAPVITRFAFGARRETREQRELVDHGGNVGLDDCRSAKATRPHDDVGDHSPPSRSRIRRSRRSRPSARATEKPDARLVDADILEA